MHQSSTEQAIRTNILIRQENEEAFSFTMTDQCKKCEDQCEDDRCSRKSNEIISKNDDYSANTSINCSSNLNQCQNNKIQKPNMSSPKNGFDNQSDPLISSSQSKSSTSEDGKKIKKLKGLIKKKIDPKQDFIKSHNKRVKFSETMQVFCYESPDNQMPQIIALKPDMSLMEFQTYMFEPPAEYQDLLTFEPPPDYRDFIANSLNVFRNEVTFDYIDDDGDDDSEISNEAKENNDKMNHINSLVVSVKDQLPNSKWQSMILDNNLDSLEEEQIIGVLKEDDILQAIGSQVTLPVNSESNGSLNKDYIQNENDLKQYSYVLDGDHHYEENLSSEDFPVHHLNSYLLNTSNALDEEDEEACCIDSSPNGSLQDLASDSSITSQDTIILINQNKSFHLESVSHSNISDDQMNNDNFKNIENLYQNLKACNKELCDINHVVNGETYDSIASSSLSSNDELNEKNKSEVDSEASKDNPIFKEAIYENTSEILVNFSASKVSTASSLVSNHVKNFENRLSTSSSEDSKSSEESDMLKNIKNSGSDSQSIRTNNKFHQNILFYERMMEQQNSYSHQQLHVNNNKNNNNNRTSPVSENQENKIQIVPTLRNNTQTQQQQTIQTNKYSVKNDVDRTVMTVNSAHLPYYTIENSVGVSSSSSSLSSTSSSSSLIPPVSGNNILSKIHSVPQISVSNLNQQIAPQVSPNSNSSSSSSASNNKLSSVGFLVQYASKNSSQSSSPTSDSINHSQQANNNVATSHFVQNINEASSNTTSFPNMPSEKKNISNRMPEGFQSRLCVVNNVPQQQINSQKLRPGQVIYRYPYAFIQPGANGISTLRPVQYIVQTQNGNGNLKSTPHILYSPQLVVNQTNYETNSSTNTGQLQQQNHQQSISKSVGTLMAQHAQVVVPANGSISGEAQITSVPVRRIIVPKGTAVLTPSHIAMQLHPHHKQVQQSYCIQNNQSTIATTASTNETKTQTTQAETAIQVRQAIPAYVGHIEQQPNGAFTEFPNPSEIRRRDGLYAYPQILIKKEVSNSSQKNENNEMLKFEKNFEDNKELEEFVQKEQQRTERIKKRYSFTEDEDPTFGFARRPSVRGIRPKFGSTTEIIQQMNSTLPKSVVSQRSQNHVIPSNNITAVHQPPNTVFFDPSQAKFTTYSQIPKNAQFIQVNRSNSKNPQMISIIKPMGDVQLNVHPNMQQQQSNAQLKSQTLPRLHKINPANNSLANNISHNEPTHEIVRIIDAKVLNGSTLINSSNTFSQEQLKLHLQKALEQQQLQKSNKILLQPPTAQSTNHRFVLVGTNNETIPNNVSPNHQMSSSTANNLNKLANKQDSIVAKPSLVNDNKSPNPISSSANNNDVVYYSLNV